MTPPSVLVCRDARGAHWQLGPLPPARGRVTLIGWTHAADSQDSGVPRDVAGLLARALTSVARVTFPSSDTDASSAETGSSLEGSLVRALTGQGVVERTKARLRGTASDLVLISTQRPDVVLRAFDDGGFPWSLQGQALLLSAPEVPPPDINEPTLRALFEDDWAEQAAGLSNRGVQGVVRPGVDGDVAGAWSSSDAFDQQLLEALERETRLAGLSWSIVPEAAL